MSKFLESLGGYSLGTQPSQSSESSGFLESLGGHTLPQEPSLWDQAGRSLARGAKDIGVGLLEGLDFVASPIRGALNLGSQALGRDTRFSPVAESVNHAVDEATHGYTRNRNARDEIASAATKALGSLPVGGAFAKAAGHLPRVGPYLEAILNPGSLKSGKEIAINAAMPAVGTAYAQDNPHDALGRLGAELGTGAGLGLTGKGRGALGNWVGHKTKFNPEAHQSFLDSGIQPLLSDLVDSKTIRMAENQLAHHPVAASLLEDTRHSQKEAILKLLGQKKTGSPLGREEASALAKQGRDRHLAAQKAKHKVLYKQHEFDLSQIDQTITRTPHITQLFKESLNKLSLSNPDSLKIFQESPVGSTLIDLYHHSRQGTLDYPYLKQVLNEINNKVTTHGLVGKQEQGALKHLAATITKDRDQTLGKRFRDLGDNSET